MYRHPPDRTSLPPLSLSETTVLCPACVSTVPLRGVSLYRIHSETHTHSYPTAPEAIAATPTGRSASAPHHTARCKSTFSLRPGAQATDTAKCGCNGMALPCVLMGVPRPELQESLQTDKHGLQKTQRHHFQAHRRSTRGASIRLLGKRMRQNSFPRSHQEKRKSR